MVSAIKDDFLLSHTILFNQGTDQCVTELVYCYMEQLATRHRSYLRDIRTVYFLHTLVSWAIDLEGDVDLVRYLVRSLQIFGNCVSRWNLEQSVICCWVLVHCPPLDRRAHHLLELVRSSPAARADQDFERTLAETCGNILPLLPSFLDHSFRRWLILNIDVTRVDGVFSACATVCDPLAVHDLYGRY